MDGGGHAIPVPARFVRLRTDESLSRPTPEVDLDETTVDRLDSLRVDDESYDEIVTEPIDIYEAQELTLSFAGDRLE